MITNDRPRTPGFSLRLILAWIAILWERVWRAGWRAACIAGLLLSVALSDVLPALPGWLHLAALIGFASGIVVTLWRGFRFFAAPTFSEARRRLEIVSELEHRPLALLRDNQATGADDPGTRSVWLAHRKRMLEKLGNLRSVRPAPGLAGRDPLAFRGGVLVLLCAALVISWGEGWERIARAGLPDIEGAAAAGPAALEVWLTPPPYTRLAPRFLTARQTISEPLSVPAGAKLLAHVRGGLGTPELILGPATIPFTAMSARSFRAESKLTVTTRLTVTQRGRTLGQWAINVVRDQPPSIGFLRAPSKTSRSTLRLEFEAKDDYGIATVRAYIRRANQGNQPGDEVITLKLPAGAGRKALKSASYHDLTAHRWAGLPVTIRLEAVDAIGQKGLSAPIKTILPERIFTHPIAQALAEARKDLIRDPTNTRQAVAEIGGDLSARPGRYNHDIVAFMAMRSARARLYMDRSKRALREVSQLLWDTALRIEDGRLSLAERDLRKAQKELMEALSKDRLADKELQRLVDQLQKALDRFMRQLAEQMKKNPERLGQDNPLDRNAMVLEQRDLQRMLKRLRDLARSGNRSAAREMLSTLRRMLENLQSMARRRSQQGKHPAAKVMRDLQRLIQRQQRLMDRTFRDAQRLGERPGQRGENAPGQKGENAPGRRQGETRRSRQGMAGEQEALRRGLGGVMRELDELLGRIPGNLGRAEREMRGAGEALRRGQPDRAVPPQGRALQQLRSGSRQAMRRLMQRYGRRLGMMRGRPGWRRGDRRDPFGRRREGIGRLNTSDIKIPEESELQRAREIMDELRRRAGERQRPKLERDYIDRLLRRF